jgi:GNAT superfamily N-acetyltransferase
VIVRALDHDSPSEIELVAARMRATLVEVLGEERGGAMYTMDWLVDRVRFHLDPARSTGEVFVAVDETGQIAGHTIVRVEVEDGERLGYFSTTYVIPEARRRGLAHALIEAGEAWMRARAMTRAATDTADDNHRLHRLFAAHGYAIVYRSEDKRMVRLARPLDV